MAQLKSTKLLFRSSTTLSSHRPESPTVPDPVVVLFRIIDGDLQDIIKALEWALEDISYDSLDDYLMTRRLSDWCKMMNDYEVEIPQISKSISAFAEAVIIAGDEQRRSDVAAELQRIVRRAEKAANSAKTRLDKAYAGLRADMQLTESRRSISEAQTVTRLTELAFFFIPLSFASSILSISVNELNNGVPIWTFVVTAVLLAALAYSVRLVIGSDFLADTTRGALEQFWASRNVQRGENAPILTLVTLTVAEIWKRGGSKYALRILVLAFMSSFIVVPVAFMWKVTHMHLGFNVAITVSLIFYALAIAFLTTSFFNGRPPLPGWGRLGNDTGDSSEEEV
jgi:hypothetical protein